MLHPYLNTYYNFIVLWRLRHNSLTDTKRSYKDQTATYLSGIISPYAPCAPYILAFLRFLECVLLTSATGSLHLFHLPYIFLLLGHHHISLSGSFYFPLRAHLNYCLSHKGFVQLSSVDHFSYITLHGTMYLHSSLGNFSLTLMYALVFNKYLPEKQINESFS